MKTLKLIFASLFISFGLNAQTGKISNSASVKEKNPEQIAKSQTEKMKTELNLTNDQYDKAYQINLGIVQKNNALQGYQMTTEERKNAFKQNNQARIAMLKEILTEEQFNKMQEKIKEKKSSIKQ
jgi:protein CpxP